MQDQKNTQEAKDTEELKPVVVRLLKRYGPVNPNEIAGYPSKIAELLISRKYAVRV